MWIGSFLGRIYRGKSLKVFLLIKEHCAPLSYNRLVLVLRPAISHSTKGLLAIRLVCSGVISFVKEKAWQTSRRGFKVRLETPQCFKPEMCLNIQRDPRH